MSEHKVSEKILCENILFSYGSYNTSLETVVYKKYFCNSSYIRKENFSKIPAKQFYFLSKLQM